MVDTERWKARFRAARVSLPGWAEDAPHRCVYRSNATGTWEIYAWDRTTGVRRQVTDRPNGTVIGGIDPTGEWIWWFADNNGDEFGVWRRQPFGGGDDEVAAPGLDPSYPAGLALGSSGLAVIARSSDGGSTIHLCLPGGSAPRTVYTSREDAYAIDLSGDESLIAINHSEHGDSRHMALRVIRTDGETVADLWDGPGKGLAGIAFSPVDGDPRLLVEHERRGKPEPLVWDPHSGAAHEIELDLPGEVGASWYPDASGLLISHSHHARDELYRYTLATGELARIQTPRGVIGSATARPDGTVEFSWSSAASPPVIRSTSGTVVLTPPGPPPPESVPVTDAWVEGPGGRIHALVSRPPDAGPGPYPCVFDIHGGPTAYDDDSFVPDAAAWVDHGFAVVRVNYRGSAGYGSAWRDAIEGRPGLTELEDIAAVRDWAISTGLADPARIVLTGGSWGGFLTLLGLGTRPRDWTVGIAIVPVADYVAAYEDEMEALQAFDRSLFGGSPAEAPDRYAASSPITYVDKVTAPVLVMAGENDPRCPIRQIDNYLARLADLGKDHEVYRYDAGHGSLVVEERIRQVGAAIDFARKHLALS